MNRTKISIRIDNDLLAVIEQYARLVGIDKSEAIRRFCRMGVQNKANLELQEQFIEKQHSLWKSINRTTLAREGKNLIFERDGYKCRKCRSSTDLVVYHIDKNPLNKDSKLQITLCERCKEWAEKYSPQRRVFEDFVEWLSLV